MLHGFSLARFWKLRGAFFTALNGYTEWRATYSLPRKKCFAAFPPGRMAWRNQSRTVCLVLATGRNVLKINVDILF
jgi:hypothetical protein